MRYALKLMGCVGIILTHFVVGSIWSAVPSDIWRRRLRAWQIHWLACLTLIVLGMRLKRSLSPMENGRPHLIVANHLSYLDVVVIASTFPSVFVTSRETGALALLGTISKLGGSILVDRQNPINIKHEIRSIADILEKNLNVCVFPEATSSDGSQILPFKRALLQSAVHAKAIVYPVVIQYLKINEEPITLKNRDLAFFYGDMDFVKHMKALLRVRSIEIRLETLEPIESGEEKGSRELCDHVESLIRNRYEPVRA